VPTCFADVGRPDIEEDATALSAAVLMAPTRGIPCPTAEPGLLARSYDHYGMACEPRPSASGGLVAARCRASLTPGWPLPRTARWAVACGMGVLP
jgi:hypothetical protein